MLTAGTQEEIVETRGLRYRRVWVVEDDLPHSGMKTVTVRVVSLREHRVGPSSTVTVSFYHVP